MNPVKDLPELRAEYRKIHSVATDTDRWLCKAFMFLIDQGFGQKKPKRPPSEYNRFVGERMKKGETLQQASRAWSERTR